MKYRETEKKIEINQSEDEKLVKYINELPDQVKKAYEEYFILRENFNLIGIEPLKMDYKELLEYLIDNGFNALINQISYQSENNNTIISVNQFSDFHNNFINFIKKEC